MLKVKRIAVEPESTQEKNSDRKQQDNRWGKKRDKATRADKARKRKITKQKKQTTTHSSAGRRQHNKPKKSDNTST